MGVSATRVARLKPDVRVCCVYASETRPTETVNLRSHFKCGLILALLLLAGCLHVDSEPPATHAEPPADQGLPVWRAYWTGITLKGARIGFSKLALVQESDGLVRIDADLGLAFQFLGEAKRISLKSRDWVDRDLALIRFEHVQRIDGTERRVSGRVAAGVMRIESTSAGRMTEYEIEAPLGLMPSSALLLAPLRRGLQAARDDHFHIFDSELGNVVAVRQRIHPLAKLPELPVDVHQVESDINGAITTSWLDAEGRPRLESSLGGAILSRLEEEQAARSYMTAAALNKQDVLLDFSRVSTDYPLPDAQRMTRLGVRLYGIPEEFSWANTLSGQQCERQNLALVCKIDRDALLPVAELDAESKARWTSASMVAPADDPRITRLAGTIGRGASPRMSIARIMAWMDANIRKTPADSFSALDVLDRGEAECQGHSSLFAALARAQGIPTRIVNGLVYTQSSAGFLFHTWTESFVEGRWISVDPTFSQVPADATHVGLVIGENPQDLAPLIQLIGRLRAEVDVPITE